MRRNVNRVWLPCNDDSGSGLWVYATHRRVDWDVVRMTGSHVEMGSSLATMMQAAHEGKGLVTAI